MSKKRLIILGSTGSIGTQALEVIRAQRDRFDVVGLSANQNAGLLKQQAQEFGVPKIVLNQGEADPLIELVQTTDADMVLVAVSGTAGLLPTLAAIRSGKNIALANKEALVMGGDEIMSEAKKAGIHIVPVDSEHSAIFQCLQKVKKEDVAKIMLTCSGGAFRGKKREDLTTVTVADALAHPTWAMGKRISIDCATLVNKGLEVIEAHHLFGFEYDQIEVRLHPQSLVHGIVQLKDGNTFMHLSPPDMRIPLNAALNFTERVELPQVPTETLLKCTLEFSEPDHDTFPGIKMAYEVGRQGGLAPALFVTANERAVNDFLEGKLSFLGIYDRIEAALREQKTQKRMSVDAITEMLTAAL